ncbi:MAG: hypothetical protein K2Y37_18770 [Pirellulales bacterium]|nr:hypothetical protein [Pirellulales bacterium]
MADTLPEKAIQDEEIILRRISLKSGWYLPSADSVNPAAFRPTDQDVSGLSLAREILESSENLAARGWIGCDYYVARIPVASLAAQGIQVVARPLPGFEGHAEAPQLTAASRRNDKLETGKRMAIMADQIIEVVGPFPGNTPRPAG